MTTENLIGLWILVWFGIYYLIALAVGPANTKGSAILSAILTTGIILLIA